MKKILKTAAAVLLFVILLSCMQGALAAGYPTTADFTVTSYQGLVKTVAQQYMLRKPSFTVRYDASTDALKTAGDTAIYDAFTYDDPSTTADLDYLHWNMDERGYSGLIITAPAGSYAIYTFTQTYRTTAAQENDVTASISTILKKLNIGSAGVYAKIKAIHDYIIDTVEYDYTYKNYSAYNALYSHTAVCQGYTLLAYRLLMEAGVPGRIITGDADNGSSTGPHAWNIVKIGQYWYNLDVTWDDTTEQTAYFLKNNAAFSDHTRDSDYNTQSFNTAYPMSPVNFDMTMDTFDPAAISAWARDGVLALNKRGVIPAALMSDFQKGITRAEFTALVVNIAAYAGMIIPSSGGAPFTDIADSSYKEQIIKGYLSGIIGGASPTAFVPDGTLTREQCAKIAATTIKAVSGADISSFAELPYADVLLISDWALPYVRYSYENSLMQGADGYFKPRDVLTREQAMLIAERIIEKYGW